MKTKNIPNWMKEYNTKKHNAIKKSKFRRFLWNLNLWSSPNLFKDKKGVKDI